MSAPTTLAGIYKGWDAFQTLLVEAVKPLTDSQLDLRASAELNPAWLLAAHIIGAREGWFHEALGVDAANWDPYRDRWDMPDAPKRTATELVEGLERSWALIDGCLRRWTPDMLADEFSGERHGEHWELTRQWVIWHVLEHDHFHGGELFLTLGMHGVAVPEI
jgi:uncharacterized damage-inducible protein DinB